MNVNNNIILWVLDFLTNRPQYVKIKNNDEVHTSDFILTNTGAPQGSVLSPVLFTIYTNNCKTMFPNIPIVKYADDTAILGLISNNQYHLHFCETVVWFVTWCESHFLELNVKKTKEMTIDFRVKTEELANIEIKGEKVEAVNEYKYLGSTQ